MSESPAACTSLPFAAWCMPDEHCTLGDETGSAQTKVAQAAAVASRTTAPPGDNAAATQAERAAPLWLMV